MSTAQISITTAWKYNGKVYEEQRDALRAAIRDVSMDVSCDITNLGVVFAKLSPGALIESQAKIEAGIKTINMMVAEYLQTCDY